MSANMTALRSKTGCSESITPSSRLPIKSGAPSAKSFSRKQSVQFTTRGFTDPNLLSPRSPTGASARRSASKLTQATMSSKKSSLAPSKSGSKAPSKSGSRIPSRTASRDVSRTPSRSVSRTGLAKSVTRSALSRSAPKSRSRTRSQSAPRSMSGTAMKSVNSNANRPTASYNTVSNSRLAIKPATRTVSSYLETPTRSKAASSKYTITKVKSGPSMPSKYGNTQYKLRNVKTCAGETQAWTPISRAKSEPTRKSSVRPVSKRSKTIDVSRSRDIESQRPNEIVLEERKEVTKYRYSWWALSILAFLLCATLLFLLIKEIVESNQTGEVTTTQETPVTDTPIQGDTN